MENMKLQFDEPTVEIISFDAEDIITASCSPEFPDVDD